MVRLFPDHFKLLNEHGNDFGGPDKPTVLALTGMPGVGKSIMAQRLSLDLGIDWLDLDELISETTGKSIARIFAELGESGFRQLEGTTLRQSIAAAGSGFLVLALGGGTALTDPASAEFLKRSARVVYLWARPEILLQYLSAEEEIAKRPLLQVAELSGKIADLYCTRHSKYFEIADVVVGPDLDFEASYRQLREVACDLFSMEAPGQ